MNPQIVLLLILVADPCSSAIACRSDQFACADQQQCIYASGRCDGYTDCRDASDEQCTGRKCANYEFTCANGKCLNKWRRCHHGDDCGDGSDEQQCTQRTCACANSLGGACFERGNSRIRITSHRPAKREADCCMAWSSWSVCKECNQYRQRVEFNCSRTQESRPCICPPEINSRREKSVKLHSTLQIQCFVGAFPKPEVNWTKDGVNLGNNNTLTINRVSYGDAGQYTCSANNSEGKNESAFHITVTGPPEINPELKNQSVAYNSSLQFICSPSGFPTPEILWTKGRVNLGNNNTLTIRQARFEDSGRYTCSAKNSEGSKNSTFWIEVAGVSLQITEPPISQSVTEEYPVNLSCVASGVPTPTLVWTFNNGDLPSGINQTGYEGGSILVSPSVTREMDGTYKCTAKNKANTISSSATLRVYGKASARVVSEKYITLIQGYALALTCKVNEETISVMWKKDGERITERAVIETRLDEKKSKLALTEVVEEDSGEYSCEARNKLGTVARSVVIVNVKGNSEAPSSSSSSSSSSLEWYYIGGPLAAVVFLLALISYIKKRRETAPPHVPSRPNEGEDEVELDKLNAVVAIDDGATAFPFATNLEDKGTAAANLAHEVGKHGTAAHPLVVGIDDGATALPLGIKAGEEGCLAHHFESDKRRGEAGVQEYDGNQLTAADTDENGNDEGEESSEAAPLVQV